MKPEEHIIEVKNDFINRLSNVTPVQALSELIWNALDADAKNVTVKFHRNKLHGITQIAVIDDGHGMSQSDIIKYFSNLGGSWKREVKRTKIFKRPVHGSSGKGRFMAFSVCGKAQWNITYVQSKMSSQCSVSIDGLKRDRFFITHESQAPRGTSGVTVSLTDIKPSGEVSRLASENSIQQIAEIFSEYLRTHRGIRIVYDGKTVDHSAMINNQWSFSLPSYVDDAGETHSIQLDIVEWKTKTKNQFYLCNEREIPLQLINMHMNLTDFNITGYLTSSIFGNLHDTGNLDFIEMDSSFSLVIDNAKKEILKLFRDLSAQHTQTIVESWKKQKIYPYEGDPETHVEKMERDVFDIVAVTVQGVSPGLSSVPQEHTALQLRLLRGIIESSPNELSKILKEILKLSKRQQRMLADLLEETTLAGIIGAANLVTERLKFIDALSHMLFDAKAKRLTKERSQLHKLLEQNTWIFGERYNLWASDKELTNVLRIYAKKHNLDIDVSEPVKVQGKKRGIIDLMLSRSLCGHQDDKPEHLVVEIKAPNHVLTHNDLNQIERYAGAIDRDDRFHSIDSLKWHFWIIADRYNQDVEDRITHGPDPRNRLIGSGARKIIGVKTWAEIIHENKSRLEYIKNALEYNADEERSLGYVREKYGEILKEVTFKKDDS